MVSKIRRGNTVDYFKKTFKKILKKLNSMNISRKNGNITKANIAIVVLLGILFLITASFFKSTNQSTQSSGNDNTKSSNNSDTQNADQSVDDYETSLQNELKTTLEQIEGVGKVNVMITFESGSEKVPAVNINDSTNTSEEKDTEGGVRNTTQQNNGSTVVTTTNGDKSEPLIIKEYKPKVTGVCVVAEGAEDSVTQLRISNAVMNLFAITSDKVMVYPMKK